MAWEAGRSRGRMEVGKVSKAEGDLAATALVSWTGVVSAEMGR